MRLGDWMREASATLREAGIGHASRDVLLIAAFRLGRDKARLLAHPETELGPSEVEELTALTLRRAHREPVQYIIGRQEFWGLSMEVGPGCLIPRPETEHLVETCLEQVATVTRPAVTEIGVGSGCVLMAIATERPDALLTGIETDPAAMAWARRNLARHPAVRLVEADVADAGAIEGQAAVVSNPPYITDDEWEGLEPEVRVFEPAGALRCGSDPLGPYRSIAAWAVPSLVPGGSLICELGVAQASRAAALRRLHPGLAWERGVRDLAGRLRVAVWRRTGVIPRADGRP